MSLWLRVGRNYALQPAHPGAPIIHVRICADGRWRITVDAEDGATELPGDWALLHEAQEAAVAWLRANGGSSPGDA